MSVIGLKESLAGLKVNEKRCPVASPILPLIELICLRYFKYKSSQASQQD
jgi:hypothetical protein